MGRTTYIKFNNEQPISVGIKSGSISINKILDGNSELKFGTCNSTELQFVLRGETDYTNSSIYLYQIENNVERPLFSGVVFSCDYDTNKIDRKFICYDKFYTLKSKNVKSWYDGLTFPMTIKAFRDSLCSFTNLQQETITLANDSIYVSKAITTDELKFETVLFAIGELNGVYPTINPSGKVEYVSIKKTNPIDISGNVKSEAKFLLDTVKTIDKLQISLEDGDIGYVYGEGTNCYSIIGNFLTFGMLQEQLANLSTNLYNEIKGIVFVPASLPMIKSDLTLKLGDLVKFKDRDGNYYNTVILQNNLSGIQLFEQTISGYINTIRQEINDSISTNIKKLAGKSNVLKRDLNGLTNTVTDLETDMNTQIQQLSDKIVASVNYTNTQIEGIAEVYHSTQIPTLSNYPAEDWYNPITLPHTLPISWVYSTDSYWKHLGARVYVGNDTKPYIFTYDSTSTPKAFKWVQSDKGDVKYLTNSVAQLMLAQTEIAMSVSGVADIISGQTEVTKDMKASINLKLNKADLVSEINATADVIHLKSNNFILESDYTNIDKFGRISASVLVLENNNASEELGSGYIKISEETDLQKFQYIATPGALQYTYKGKNPASGYETVNTFNWGSSGCITKMTGTIYDDVGYTYRTGRGLKSVYCEKETPSKVLYGTYLDGDKLRFYANGKNCSIEPADGSLRLINNAGYDLRVQTDGLVVLYKKVGDDWVSQGKVKFEPT